MKNLKQKALVALMLLVMLLALILLVYFVFIRDNDKEDPTPETKNYFMDSKALEEASKVDDSGLSEHNTKEDCWIVQDNKIYEFTSLLKTSNIANVSDCGKVVTKPFTESDLELLAPYYIADYKTQE